MCNYYLIDLRNTLWAIKIINIHQANISYIFINKINLIKKYKKKKIKILKFTLLFLKKLFKIS